MKVGSEDAVGGVCWGGTDCLSGDGAFGVVAKVLNGFGSRGFFSIDGEGLPVGVFTGEKLKACDGGFIPMPGGAEICNCSRIDDGEP